MILKKEITIKLMVVILLIVGILYYFHTHKVQNGEEPIFYNFTELKKTNELALNTDKNYYSFGENITILFYNGLEKPILYSSYSNNLGKGIIQEIRDLRNNKTIKLFQLTGGICSLCNPEGIFYSKEEKTIIWDQKIKYNNEKDPKVKKKNIPKGRYKLLLKFNKDKILESNEFIIN